MLPIIIEKITRGKLSIFTKFLPSILTKSQGVSPHFYQILEQSVEKLQGESSAFFYQILAKY